jgi:hypothetical protein
MAAVPEADMPMKKRILALVVNYGREQLDYLERVTTSLKSFKKYDVTVVVHSNVPLDGIGGIDSVTLYERKTGIRSLNDLLVKLKLGTKWSGRVFNFHMLPMTCRKVIVRETGNYDYFIFTENDHLWQEHHVDRFISYEALLPEDRITGLIQFEINPRGRFYPAYHPPYEWDYDSVEKYGDLFFAHFDNVHQGSFLISRQQLIRINERCDFSNFLSTDHYSPKCKTNTDLYQYCGMKKLICISEFEQNLIHHLSNVYIEGDLGRDAMRSDEQRMRTAITRLLDNGAEKYSA